MGIAASASPPAPPTEAAPPADPPAKEEPQRLAIAAAADEADAAGTSAASAVGGGGAGEDAETVVVDVAAAAGEEGEGEGEEEQGECGFCLFMKGGGCKEEFIVWEKCVEEAEAAGDVDVVERCQDATAALRKCMGAHADYYEPILRAERAMAEDLEARDGAPSEPTPTSSSQEAAPAPAPGEEGHKKQAAEAAVSVKESGDPAA